jgi:hypothetical protein
MFRFTIRDVLWLMVVVAIAAAWGTDRWRQSARWQALEVIAGLEAIELFPRDWEGTMAAVRNQHALCKFRVDALTRELESRGHRVEIEGCNVFVDRPTSPLNLPIIPDSN